jgi:hypothetical protein
MKTFVALLLLFPALAGASTWTTTVNGLAPVAGYRLNETSGTSAADTQAANPGTIVNTPTLGVTSLVPNDTDKAMQFAAASSQYVTVSGSGLSTIFNSATNASILFAAKWSANTDRIVVGFCQSGGTRFMVRKDNDGSMIALVEGGQASGMQLNSPPAAGTHLILMTFDGTQGTANNRVKVYVDGASAALTNVVNASPTALNNTVGQFEIGRALSDSMFANGTIDEVYLFHSTLSSTDATNLYNAFSSTGTTPTLASPTVPAAGSTLTATLNTSGCSPASGTGGFTLAGTTATVASWAISGTTLTLTLANVAEPGETITYTYAHAGASSPIVNGSNQLADFSTVAVTNNSAVPLAPSSLATGTITNTTVSFTFTANDSAPNAATSYTVQYDISNTFATANPITVTAGQHTGSATPLTASTLYYFRARANDAAGSSNWSNTVSGTTIASPTGNNRIGLDIGIGLSSAANSDVTGRMGWTTTRSGAISTPRVTN